MENTGTENFDLHFMYTSGIKKAVTADFGYHFHQKYHQRVQDKEGEFKGRKRDLEKGKVYLTDHSRLFVSVFYRLDEELSMYFHSIDELVQHGRNGLIFNDSLELVQQLVVRFFII